MLTDPVNGYRNYPTFAVALWFDNDEALQQEVAAEAAAAWAKATGNEFLDRSGEARYLLKEALKSKLESIQDGETPNLSGLMSDLLGFALEQVDLYELADNYLGGLQDEGYTSKYNAGAKWVKE